MQRLVMKTKNYRCAPFGLLVWLSIVFPAGLLAADRFRVAYSALNASQSYLWVAQDTGLYTKHGLDVDLLYINSGSMNIAALVGGSIQVAGGGPVSIEARLRGIKLLILANPLPFLAANLVTVPEIKAAAELKGKVGGISRFGSSTDQGFRYLFRKAGLSAEKDLKLLQLGGDASRLAALKIGKIQYTFLGAAATEQARTQGYHVLATAQQMGIPFPWTSVVVDESWLGPNREVAYRYLKALTEAIWYMKRHRVETERIIGRYMRVSEPQLARMEYDFVISLLPDYASPTVEGVRLILENFGSEFSDAARRDPKEFIDGSLVDRLKREQFVEGLKS